MNIMYNVYLRALIGDVYMVRVMCCLDIAIAYSATTVFPADVCAEKDGWHGMAWHGMGWHGMAWDGMGWHGMAWDGMGWHRMAWDGMAWDGMGWHGMA